MEYINDYYNIGINCKDRMKTHKNAKIKILNRKNILESGKKYWMLRRFQDIILSFFAIIVLMPLFVIVSIAIYIDDPHGSPFYSQIRCGRDAKPFRIYKFRSMYVEADRMLESLLMHNEMDGPAFKMKNDPRITKIGAFIRKTSIDELPQLFNVLKGDMSIVGPRPALPSEVEMYTEEQKQRMFITPGLTCYWQIQPKRNELSFDEWMELDMKYIKERSFLVDWKIIFLTVVAIVKGYGA